MNVVIFIAVVCSALYIAAVLYTNRSYSKWPLRRTFCCCVGIMVATVAVTGPIAHAAHESFTYHMLSHLLLTMLAPLLLAFSAPITLLLRMLPVKQARILTTLFKSDIVQIMTHPAVVTTINVTSLYALYTTGLYAYMHMNEAFYVFVHVHMFLAGYLFTVSIIYIDPIFHRHSFRKRAIALILAIAGHSIVAKYIYSDAPIGVPTEQAQVGSMLMYYGGDLIDAVLIFVLCWQWYKETKPKAISYKVL